MIKHLKLIAVTLAINISTCAAGAYGYSKAELDYQFDADTLRPAVLADAKEHFKTGMTGSSESCSPVIGETDIRLVDGEIPVYDLDGNVVAYFFMIYLKPGPLPTLKEIRESTEDFEAVMKKRWWIPDEDAVSFFAREYPFMNNCAWAVYGANNRFPTWITERHLPGVFLNEPEAKNIAKSVNGGRDVKEPKLVVFGTGALALQFEIGDDVLIVPVDRYKRIDKEAVLRKSAFPESDFYRKTEFDFTDYDIQNYYEFIKDRDTDGEFLDG